MDYIRRFYGVPAKRGRRVRFKGVPGTITGSCNARLRIRLDGDNWYISEIVLSDGRTVSIREIETKTGQPPTRPASMTGL